MTTTRSPSTMPPMCFKPAFLAEFRTRRPFGRRVHIMKHGRGIDDDHSLFIPAGAVLDDDELVALVLDYGWPETKIVLQLSFEKLPPGKTSRYIRRSTLRPPGWRDGLATTSTAPSPTPSKAPSAIETILENKEAILTFIAAMTPVIIGVIQAFRAASSSPSPADQKPTTRTDEEVDDKVEKLMHEHLEQALKMAVDGALKADARGEAAASAKKSAPRTPCQTASKP